MQERMHRVSSLTVCLETQHSCFAIQHSAVRFLVACAVFCCMCICDRDHYFLYAVVQVRAY